MQKDKCLWENHHPGRKCTALMRLLPLWSDKDRPLTRSSPTSYSDFSALGLTRSEFIEMDTVLSAMGSLKCILTLYFPDTELFLAYLMSRRTPGSVRLVFEQIQKSLGRAYGLNSVFSLILTPWHRIRGFGTPGDSSRWHALIIVTSCTVTRKEALRMSTPCFVCSAQREPFLSHWHSERSKKWGNLLLHTEFAYTRVDLGIHQKIYSSLK